MRQKQTSLFLDRLPFLCSLGLTFISVFVLVAAVMNQTEGVFMYPLDDPFIHMEIAANLAFHSNWGINPTEFASASSSILYTLILAGIFKIFSVNALVPFIVNCIAGFLLLIVIHSWLSKAGLGKLKETIIGVLIVLLVPLPVMILSGMEHVLQCLFSFLFISEFADWTDKRSHTERTAKVEIPWRVLIYALLVTAIRYEGLFLVCGASLVLLMIRNISLTVILVASAFLPVFVFGIYSISKGSYFLPNPVFIKSSGMELSVRGIAEYFSNILINKLTIVKTSGVPAGTPPPGISLLAAQRCLIIVPLAYLLISNSKMALQKERWLLVILAVTLVLHLALASTGWFYRYEAYLVLITGMIVMLILFKYPDLWWKDKSVVTQIFGVLLAFALLFPFVLRSSAAFTKASRACVNIFDQQYQMAGFLREHYNTSSVAANDIGAIAFYTQSPIVDLWGLGSIDVARSKKLKYWTPEFLDSLVRKKDVRIAIVYDEWFAPELLEKWKKVATWQIHDNVITGGEFVSFYAIEEKEVPVLLRNLTSYQSKLPKSVGVKYME